MQATPPFHIYCLSEGAVSIEFGNEISEHTLQKITAFNILLRQKPFTGFYTSVAAYTTLSVFFDPLQVIELNTLTGTNCFEKVSAYLTTLAATLKGTAWADSETITIPVCYGGEFGPDIEEVANLNSISVQQVIQIHTQAVYIVHMIGFVPGFAYLGGMSPLIAAPRKSVPQAAIPAGAVGIAGGQTGIYPLKTPGGWQIIGQTPLKMFDVDRAQPAILKAGDKVVFKPISRANFSNY